MVHFRFPIRQLPPVLQEFATEVETIVDQVLKQGDAKGGSCSGDSCQSTDSARTYAPAVDIYESENHFDFYVDLPGAKSDAVKIEIQDERLIISGMRSGVEKTEGVSAHRVERATGNFYRSIRMPKQLDVEKIEARFDNGVLHVHLPKQVKPSPRTIEIKTSNQ